MNFRIKGGETDDVIRYIEELSDQKEYDVIIKLRRKQRTMRQNKLYWLWIACISDETGCDMAEAHNELSERFLPKDTVFGMRGEAIERPVSTTRLSTEQFTYFLERVQAFASVELGIILPDPVDSRFEQFNEYYQNRV